MTGVTHDPASFRTGSMNEITRFMSKQRVFRTATLTALSCLILALGACQSTRSVSDRMESKYSLKKRKTSISRLWPQGFEQCELPVRVSEGAFRAMLELVESSKGVKYRFGGASPEGFDCSGFVQYLYSNTFRLVLPRTSTDLALLGPIISRNRLEPGDLLFFVSGNDIGHVGVYLGNQRFAHASSSAGVTVSSLFQNYYSDHFAFGTRIIKVK